MKKWKKVSSKIVYENNWFNVTEDEVVRPDGKEGLYGVLHKPSGCRIIAENNNSEIALIEIHRYPVGEILLEIPAGVNEEGLSNEENVNKELKEEIGVVSSNLYKLGKIYTAGGLLDMYDNVFLARNLKGESSTENQEGDEGIMNVEWFGLDEVKDMISHNRIKCSLTLASLNLYFEYLRSKEK